MSSPPRQLEPEEFRKRTLRLMEAFVYDFMKKNDCEDSARTYYNEKNLENWPPPWLAHNFPIGSASNNIKKNTTATTLISDNYNNNTPPPPPTTITPTTTINDNNFDNNTREFSTTTMINREFDHSNFNKLTFSSLGNNSYGINNDDYLKMSDLDDLFGSNLKSGLSFFSEHEDQQHLDNHNDLKMEEEKGLLNIRYKFDSDNNNNENSDGGNVDVTRLYFTTSSPSISSSTSPTTTSSAPLSRTRIMNMDHNQNQQNIDHDDKSSPQPKDSNEGQGRNHQDNDSPPTNDKQLPDLSLPLDVPEGFLTEWFSIFWEVYKSTHESIVGKPF